MSFKDRFKRRARKVKRQTDLDSGIEESNEGVMDYLTDDTENSTERSALGDFMDSAGKSLSNLFNKGESENEDGIT